MTAVPLAVSAQRRSRLVKICEALPETVVEAAGESHLTFRIRKRIFGYYLFDPRYTLITVTAFEIIAHKAALAAATFHSS
jgi:hypothetical protein